eukprot:CAMPEP_0202487128 /NCGR_PEP_ID=MMETSP1361-20130828/5546_1 /ASSEMBLY_ACC=CAM_ASM_000849 /TAXON_ID=210615 /ORGANISM="Staurosira complex sp., Strain CCMP2646" /LENGTH=89 /DNA_ID=CAMNT_0049116449 /DNA_START=35 /DNA_END=301 /DNA_ORIENTATION=-
MLARSALARTVARTSGSRRSMSDAPKMHKYKNCEQLLKETRPPSGHAHLTFNPPYNPVHTTTGILLIMAIGYGTMYAGMRHQQIKQGYW